MIFILTLVVVLGFVEVEVEVKDFKAVVLDWEQWEESSGLVVHSKDEEYVSDSIFAGKAAQEPTAATLLSESDQRERVDGEGIILVLFN